MGRSGFPTRHIRVSGRGHGKRDRSPDPTSYPPSKRIRGGGGGPGDHGGPRGGGGGHGESCCPLYADLVRNFRCVYDRLGDIELYNTVSFCFFLVVSF